MVYSEKIPRNALIDTNIQGGAFFILILIFYLPKATLGWDEGGW